MAEVCTDLSVVVTTYKAPASLRLVLLALSRQETLPAEVLVADDGSDEDTAQMLAGMAPQLPFALGHVWQPDVGFRAARSRNNAIHVASGRRLAFLDQDILPHRDWLLAHAQRLAARRVCIGFVMDLPQQASATFTADGVVAGTFEAACGPGAHRELDALQRKYAFYALLRRLGVGQKAKPKLRSCNVSVCRSDLLDVNGFDEDYVGWGQEDDDLGRRLYGAGVQPVALVNRALVSHMPHALRHAGSWCDGANAERYAEAHVPTRCSHGLADHPHRDVKVTFFK